jgi:hypothetical protein
VRAVNRVCVRGTCEAADRLRVLLDKCSFVLVPDSTAALTIECQDGEDLSLDTVESPIERALEANLEELDARFECGSYRKRRATGNRDPRVAVVTVPTRMAEGVAIALLRAVVQCTEQRIPVETLTTPMALSWWRRLWV